MLLLCFVFFVGCLIALISVLVCLACVFIAWLLRLPCELAFLTCFRASLFACMIFVTIARGGGGAKRADLSVGD